MDHRTLFSNSQASHDREDDAAGLADQGLEPHQLRDLDPVEVTLDLQTNKKPCFSDQSMCWLVSRGRQAAKSSGQLLTGLHRKTYELCEMLR